MHKKCVPVKVLRSQLQKSEGLTILLYNITKVGAFPLHHSIVLKLLIKT